MIEGNRWQIAEPLSFDPEEVEIISPFADRVTAHGRNLGPLPLDLGQEDIGPGDEDACIPVALAA
jgi:hypothetical protein